MLLQSLQHSRLCRWWCGVIDTLKLVLHDYDASDADLELQPATVNVKSGTMNGNFPLYQSGARMIEGRKAFNNDGPCRVEIKAIPSRDECGMQPLCTVALEVPKVAGCSNYHPTDQRGAEAVLAIVQKHLSDIGLKTNLMDAQPARLDAFRNVVADESYSCYAPVLALLRGSRMEKRGYENGHLWENGVQQVCVYDKIQKMQRDKLSVDGLPSNSIRFEMRLLKSQKVRDTLDVKSARELLESYDAIVQAYERTMKKQLFSYTVRDVEAMVSSDIRAEVQWFQDTYGRNFEDYWLKACGLKYLTARTTLETVIAVLDELGADRSKKSRMRSKMDKSRFDVEALRCVGPSTRTTGQLYEEMREKVFARSVT
jgi:hypothetical protein